MQQLGMATVAIETITPGLAKIWLETMFEGQRKIRAQHAHRLARAMLEGKWRLNSDAIALIGGRLANGQELKALAHEKLEIE